MTDRYAENVKIVTGTDEIRSNLADPSERESIPGRRGIAYMQSDGRGVQKVSGTTGSAGTQIPTVETGSLDTGDVQNSTWVDPRNPLNSIKRAGDNSYEVENFMDDVDSPQFNTPTQDGMGELLNGSGGSLETLTGLKDCDTGDEFEVWFGNEDPVPPADWDTWNELPPLLDWVAGTNWINSNAAGLVNNTAGTGANITEAADAIVGFEPGISTVTPPLEIVIGTHPEAPTTGHDGWARYKSVFVGGADVILYYSQFSCTIDVDTGCSSAGPSNAFQPTDGHMTLNWKESQFEDNAFEPATEVIADFVGGGFSQVDFCFGPGDARTGTVRAAINGGFMIYETSSDGGPPTNIIKIFDGSAQMYAATDINGLQAYLPQGS